jgi:hypothetical protein
VSALPVSDDLPGDQMQPESHIRPVAGQPLDRGHSTTEAHWANAAVEPSAHLDQRSHDPQLLVAEVGTFAGRAIDITEPSSSSPDQHPRDGHSATDPHSVGVGAATLPDQFTSETQCEPAGQGGESPPPVDPRSASVPIVAAGRPEDVVLAITADLLDDLEKVRIATENRVRSLGQVKGLDGTAEADRMAGMVDGIKQLEHDAELELKRAMRAHPLGPAVKAMRGVGDKQAGRLLAAIGDPYIHSVTGQPRRVSQLWAYAGYHVLRSGQSGPDAQVAPAGADTSQGGDAGHPGTDTQAPHAGVAPSRARGQRANWNDDAKMRAFLVAESCLKQLRKPCVKPDGQAWAEHVDGCQCSPYRIIYDDGRRKYAEAVHSVACKRCGPAGKPAAAGSPLSEGHKHARAIRLISKAVLRDLWIAGRDLHEGEVA